MNGYRDTMNQLHFTPEQKARMVDRLMAQERPAARRARPLRRLAAAGIAAALIFSVSVAGATGALGDVGAAFSAIFKTPAATQVIDQIGYPVGVAATDSGITITADAIIGDTYSYAVVYTIQREDGAALVRDEILAQGANPETGTLPLAFQSYDVVLQGYRGGSHARTWFYDADPADSAIQFVELRTGSIPLETGDFTARFQNLQLYNQHYTSRTTLARGSWTLTFRLDFEDSSRTLPGGQTFQLDGTRAVLDSVTLSPLSIQANYTVYSSGDPSADWLEPLAMSITYTDGTTLDLSHAGGTSTRGGDGGIVRCQKGMIFDTIRPLDQVESVTVGDVVIPVSP